MSYNYGQEDLHQYHSVSFYYLGTMSENQRQLSKQPTAIRAISFRITTK